MSRAKILVVDDEPHIVELISMNLKMSEYDVVPVYDGEQAVELIQSEKPDLVLLDIMLPGIDGLEICKIIKDKSPEIPVIMLSAKSTESDKIDGLKGGADDYITKPFSIVELLARIEAAIRRTEILKSVDTNDNDRMICARDLELHLKKMTLVQAGRTVLLTRAEFLILKELIGQKDKVVSREVLLSASSSESNTVRGGTLDVHILNLRKKLSERDGTNCIKTLRGIGYLFESRENV